jgi:hypothetical protein
VRRTKPVRPPRRSAAGHRREESDLGPLLDHGRFVGHHLVQRRAQRAAAAQCFGMRAAARDQCVAQRAERAAGR